MYKSECTKCSVHRNTVTQQVMGNLWFAIAVLCSFACFQVQAILNSTNSCPPFVSSCREAYLREKCSGKTPTNGEYDIAFMHEGNQYFRRVYCDMESTNCGPDKGWMRVAYMDMTHDSKCPEGLDEGMYGSKKLCGNRGSGCLSTMINTYGAPYTEVCGFVAGYQYKSPDGFRGKGASIDSTYLDGISITHGKPRQHIWSYAAGLISGGVGALDCPCNEGNPDTVPKFAFDNWYCESGNPTATVEYIFFPNDVLWDGKDCTLKEPPCCQRSWLPYFHKDVGGVSTDNIELRLCHDEGFSNEDVPIESMAFFVR